MKKINIVHAVLMLSLSLLLSSAAQARQQAQSGEGASKQSRNEEKIVKGVYLKLMMLNKLARIKKADRGGAVGSPQEDLKFEISNIRTGAIEEIYDRPYGEMVTKPSGYILQVGRSIYTKNGGPERVVYEARWAFSDYTGSALENWETTTVSEVLRLVENRIAEVEKYTAYEVRVSFEGRERAYRAMALHHAPQQANGPAKIDFLDNIVGQSALADVYNESRAPLRGREPDGNQKNKPLRMRTAAEQASPSGSQASAIDLPDEQYIEARFLTDGEIDDAARVTTATIGHLCEDSVLGMCCDTNTMSCCFPYDPWGGVCDSLTCGYPDCNASPSEGGGGGGGGSGDCSPRTSYGNHRAKYAVNYKHHSFPGWGQHDVRSNMQGSCQYGSNCTVSCSVDSLRLEPAEYGFPTSACHQQGIIQKFIDGSTNCSATQAAAFKACLFCQCTVTINFNFISVVSDGFWTFEHTVDHQCPAP